MEAPFENIIDRLCPALSKEKKQTGESQSATAISAEKPGKPNWETRKLKRPLWR